MERRSPALIPYHRVRAASPRHRGRVGAGLGFDYCTYGLRTPIPLTRPKTAMYSNYPLAWQAIYQEKGYLDIDPTVQRAIRSLSPVLWSDDLFAPTPELWEEAQSFGLRAGLAQICRDADGMTGLLVLARSKETVKAAEWQMKTCHILWLVQAPYYLPVIHEGPSNCYIINLGRSLTWPWEGDRSTPFMHQVNQASLSMLC